MLRSTLFLTLITHFLSLQLFGQPAFLNADIVEEYRETKKGITLCTVVGFHDSAHRQVLDAFLEDLSKKLPRSSHIKIMIVTDYHPRRPWTAVVSYDTLRFDLDFIDKDCPPKKKDSVSEVVIVQRSTVDTSFIPPKQVAVDWSGSCDRTQKVLGLKILYKWSEADSGTIFFDRVYSLAKYGLEHLEEIKIKQKRAEVKYYMGEWLLSVLTIDTAEIKKIPLESVGFDPNNIKVDTTSTLSIWLTASMIFLFLIFFLVFRRIKRSSKLNSHSF